MPCDEGCRTAVLGKTERTVGWEGNGCPVRSELVRHCIGGNPQSTDRLWLPPLNHSFTLDCNIYVRSERAGKRVMASLRRFIEGRLRLKVNEAKSAVARPEERHFVGFCLRREPEDGRVEVRLSVRSKERIDARIRDLTPRNWGQSVRQCIERIDSYLGGWIEYFRVCTESSVRTLRALSAHLRRRLRAIILRQWKRKRTIARRLIKLGVRPRTAWRDVYAGRRGLWALSHCPAVDRGLNNAYFAALGLISLPDEWEHRRARDFVVVPAQLALLSG